MVEAVFCVTWWIWTAGNTGLLLFLQHKRMWTFNFPVQLEVIQISKRYHIGLIYHASCLQVKQEVIWRGQNQEWCKEIHPLTPINNGLHKCPVEAIMFQPLSPPSTATTLLLTPLPCDMWHTLWMTPACTHTHTPQSLCCKQNPHCAVP